MFYLYVFNYSNILIDYIRLGRDGYVFFYFIYVFENDCLYLEESVFFGSEIK